MEWAIAVTVLASCAGPVGAVAYGLAVESAGGRVKRLDNPGGQMDVIVDGPLGSCVDGKLPVLDRDFGIRWSDRKIWYDQNEVVLGC